MRLFICSNFSHFISIFFQSFFDYFTIDQLKLLMYLYVNCFKLYEILIVYFCLYNFTKKHHEFFQLWLKTLLKGRMTFQNGTMNS